MTTQASTDHEKYYVPESSPLAVMATIGLVLSVFGAASYINALSFGEPGEASPSVLYAGLFVFAATLFVWFRTTIRENLAGMNSPQLKKILRAGHVLVHLLRGDVLRSPSSVRCSTCATSRGPGWPARVRRAHEYLLWEGFQFSWPMMQTPQEAVGGAGSQLIANNGSFASPGQSMAFSEAHAWYAWLPLWNTIILLSSSVTVHFAHMGLLDGDRKKFNTWLAVTVALGYIFIGLQIAEYYEAYAHFGLTLNSGIYGSTFFMLTGFHGFHVFMG
jgi:cytochrome c oxidase subunit 3